MSGRKTRPVVYLCGITPEDAATARLHDPAPECPNAAQHAPMPADYGAWDTIAIRRMNAKQIQKRCGLCGLWLLWTGGRDVPGWPRRAIR